MSNLEAAPTELACSASQVAGIEVLHPREIPLGGAPGDPGATRTAATATFADRRVVFCRQTATKGLE